MSRATPETIAPLDLRADGRLSPDAEGALRVNLPGVCESYDRLVDEASRLNGEDVDWWASVPASRNTYVSRILWACGILSMLDTLDKEGRLPASAIVDWPVFGELLRQRFGSRLSVIVAGHGPKWKQALHSLRKAVSLMRQLWRRARAAQARRPETACFSDFTLLDSFVIPASVSGGRFRDCFYPGLMAAAGDDASIVRLPSLHSLPHPAPVFDTLRAAGPVLLREWLLTPADYLFALCHTLRIPFLKLPKLMYAGFDVSPLLRDELQRFALSEPVVQALLNYRFCRRLAEKGWFPRLLIDWFEGQAVDKCLHLGFRHYLPDVPRVGYLGFAPRMAYRCCYPTATERVAGVVPDRIAVTGQAFKSVGSQAGGNIPTIVGPAFRFTNQPAIQNVGQAEPRHLFVPLPARLSEARRLIADLAEAGEAALHWPLCLKPHPTHDLGTLHAMLAELRLPEKIVQHGGVPDALAQAGGVVGIGTNALLESAAHGIPTIVVMLSPWSILEDPFPAHFDSPLVQRATTREELAAALRRLPHLSVPQGEGERLRQLLFAPPDSAHMRSLLSL